MTKEQHEAAVKERELIPLAATELVNRIGNEIAYIFKPRYTDFGTKRAQTNGFATLSESSQTEVVVEAIAMVMGQIAAEALVHVPELEVNSLYGKLNRRVRVHGDAYHQQFLKMKETQREQNSTQGTQGRDGDASAAGAAGESQSPGNEAG